MLLIFNCDVMLRLLVATGSLKVLLLPDAHRSRGLSVLHLDEVTQLDEFEPSLLFEEIKAHLRNIIGNDLIALFLEVLQFSGRNNV